ncbi:MAG: 30S ribosomal protein S20 [Pseudomonadota bacterium]
MANTAQARKRARQAETHRQRNASLRSRMRTSVKGVIKALNGGDADAARSAYQAMVPQVDSMVGKGLLHKNTAARYKSRLNARVKALAT